MTVVDDSIEPGKTTRDEPSGLRARILARASEGLLLTTKPVRLPLLGRAFEERVATVFTDLAAIRSTYEGKLSVRTETDLDLMFDPTGLPKTEAGQSLFLEIKIVCSRVKQSLWNRIALSPERFFPDYGIWGAMSYLSSSQITLLSVGLDPSDQLIKVADGSRPPMDWGTEEGEVLFRRHVAVERWLDEVGKAEAMPFSSIRRWVAKTGIGVVPEFLAMLDRDSHIPINLPDTPKEPAVKVDQTPQILPVQTSEPTVPAPMDPREKLSMAKLLTAMAIDMYGFDPSANRSPIPGELEGLAATLGLSLTRETILQYLRLGAQQLPAGWREVRADAQTNRTTNSSKKVKP